ncbi:MAG: DNA primase, partial [Gemmatimonadales bacterium]
SEDVLLETGLLVKRDNGNAIPRFRSRLLFPIHDLRGRIVGFGGRILGAGEPKYLNSPETPIFRKGTLLYNLHQARPAIRKEEFAIVVEGYFDVLRPLLAGVENVVAGLGTSLTAEQAKLVRRYATTAVLVYDSDAAGQRATFRAADELLRQGVRVRVATLPDGEDPDSLVRAGGAKALEGIVEDAVDVLERKIQLLERKGWFGDVEHTREALDRLLPTIRAASDPITRDLYLAAVAERAKVSRETLEREIARQRRPPEPPPVERAVPGVGRGPAARKGIGARAERELLRVAVSSPGWYERAFREVEADWMESGDTRELYVTLQRAGTRDIPTHMLDALSESARLLWADLRENPPSEEDGQAGDTYEGAREYLEARPQFRAFERLAEKIPFSPEQERARLLVEQLQLRTELMSRYPLSARKFLAGQVGKRLRQHSPTRSIDAP